MARVHWPILCALAALLALAAPAGAAWGPTEDIAALESGSSFAYDGNARGDRIIVWQGPSGGFQFAQARPGAGFGPPHAVPRRDEFSEYGPTVELDERGNALLLIQYFDETDPEEIDLRDETCCTGLRGYVIRSSGAISGPKTLAPVGSSLALLDLQIGSDGRFGVLFSIFGGGGGERVEGRFGTVRGGFGPRERVPGSAGYPTHNALSFPGRRARVLRMSSKGFDKGATFDEVERVGRGRYRRLRTVARRKVVPTDVQVTTSPNGEQAASWTEYQGGTRAIAAVRRPGGAFSLRTVARSQYQSRPDPPALEPSGNAVVPIWIPEQGIMGVIRRPRRGFGSLTRLVRPADTYIPSFDADVNRRGHMLLTWVEQPQGEPARLRAAFRNSRGSVINDHTVVAEGGQFGFSYALSLDRDGRGSVAFVAGGRLRVISARIGG